MYVDHGLSFDLDSVFALTSASLVELKSQHCTRSDDAECISLYYVTQGTVCVKTGTGITVVRCRPYHSVLIGPTTRQYDVLPLEGRAVFYVLDVRPEPRDSEEILSLYRDRLRTYETPNHTTLLDFFYHTIWEFESPESQPEILSCLVATIFSIACDTDADTKLHKRYPQSSETLASSVDALIDSEYSRVHDSNGIARMLRSNTEYVERSYQMARGVSVTNALHSRRVHEACVLLCDEESFPVKQVAEWCGYTSSGQFSRVFKRLVGATPTEFRRRHGL